MHKNTKTTIKPINKPVFGYLKTLYSSFFSISCYRDVFYRWRGYGFTYFMILVTILMILPSMWIVHKFSDDYTRQLIKPMQAIPIFSVYDGRLIIFPPSMPYFIKNNHQQVIAIVNTQNSLTADEVTLIKDRYPNLLMYFQDKKIFLFYTKKTTEIQLSTFSNQMFWGKRWAKSREASLRKPVYIALMYPFIITIAFGCMVVFGFVMAMLAKVISITIYRFNIKTQSMLRLTYVALTPALTVMTLMMQRHLHSALFWFMGVFFVYVSFILMVLKRESNKLVHT